MRTVVIGAGLSGLAAAHHLKKSGHEVVVLEAGAGPGGRCATVRRDGFIVDTGPDIAAESYVNYLDLVRDIGLGDSIERSSKVVGAVRNGRVIDIDTGKLRSVIFTPLLSWNGKFRLAWGLWKMRSILKNIDDAMLVNSADMDDPEESAEQFSLRYFGREVTDYLINPLIRMVGGAVPQRISALLVPAAIGSWTTALVSIRGGLDRVPVTLASQLDVVYGAKVQTVEKYGGGVRIVYRSIDGSPHQLDARGCVITAPIHDAARIYTPLATMSKGLLPTVRYARLGDIKLAYRQATRSTAHVAQMPSSEDPTLLMYSLDHHKASDRAPPGHSLFVIYTDDGAADSLFPQSDAAIITWARGRIESLYPELKGHYSFGIVGRYPEAGYLCGPGYFRRMAQLLASLPVDSPVQIGGDVFGGGSMEVAVTWGLLAATRLLKTLGDHAPSTTVGDTGRHARERMTSTG